MNIRIVEPITPETATRVLAELAENEEAVHIDIDSAGGNLNAGLRIYDALKARQDVSISIIGKAASVASIIALAAPIENRKIINTGIIGVHNPLLPEGTVGGNHNDLKKIANTLETYSDIVASVYEAETNLTHDEAITIMDQELTLKPSEAESLGFANVYKPELEISNYYDIDMSLMDKVKNQLGMTEAPAGADAPQVEATTEAVEELTFTESQMKYMNESIAKAIEEALKAQETEVANTMATILDSIVSEGVPPRATQIKEESADFTSAFEKKRQEIINSK